MTGGPSTDEPVLREAQGRCRQLISELRRDSEALRRPSRVVAADALAEGMAAYARAAAAAEQLLRRLNHSLEKVQPPGRAE
jgi:hypothetical protein